MSSGCSTSENLIIVDTDLQCLNSNDFLPPGNEEKINAVLANQTIIIENQNNIIQQLHTFANHENQEIIMQQLAKIETSLDTMGNYLTLNSCNKSSTSVQKVSVVENTIEQINTAGELDALEKKLQDKLIMADYIDKLSYICGRKGTGNGINNCYILVDRVFSRKLMTFCSWAGGARDKKEKIPFKMYKNIISLFFKVINLSDKDFTLKDCEEFFKNVIRNSTRRNLSSIARNSAIKRRPKNLNYNRKNNESQHDQLQGGNGENRCIEGDEGGKTNVEGFVQENKDFQVEEENDADDEDM